MESAVITALTSTASSVTGMMESIVPVGLTVAGVSIAAKAGIKFFKTIIKG